MLLCPIKCWKPKIVTISDKLFLIDSIERKIMKHGARNDIVGEVVQVETGDGIMSKATVKISGEFQMSSVMTNDSLQSLALQPGDQVRVLVKAVNVLLVKD